MDVDSIVSVYIFCEEEQVVYQYKIFAEGDYFFFRETCVFSGFAAGLGFTMTRPSRM